MGDLLIGIHLWYGNREIDFTKFNFDFLEVDLETLTIKDVELLNLPKVFGFHAPHSIKFAHLYKNIENCMLKELKNVMNFASNKKAKYINYHFNFPFYKLKSIDELLKEKAKQNVLSLLREKRNCEIVFENSNKSLYPLEEIFSFLISNNAKLCLDIGHLASYFFRKEKNLKGFYTYLENFMEKFGKYVRVIHIHNVGLDENRQVVDHTLNGILDIFKILKLIKSYEVKFLVLEIFSLNVERVKFDYKIVEDFANKIRKVI